LDFSQPICYFQPSEIALKIWNHGMHYSHLASATNILWKLVEARGHDPESLFRKSGIDPVLLRTPGMRIRYTSVHQVWKMASHLVADPCFGLDAPRYWHPSYLHALGYAWLSSHSLRDALQRCVRYLRIVSEAAILKVEDRDSGLAVVMDAVTAGLRVSAQVDLSMAVFMHMCRLNYGDDLVPLEVRFIHTAPSCSRRYTQVFKAPVHFSAEEDSLLLPADAADRFLTGANPHLARLNDQVMIDYLAKLDKEDIIQRTKAMIIDRLPSGDISQKQVAPALNMSPRSLQRRLKSLGTTFSALLDETRRNLAQSYISDVETDLTEIAFLLGFSEHSAFSRAFKRWTGITPSELRQRSSQPKPS
jgi:AraC-like DNA-binding protein